MPLRTCIGCGRVCDKRELVRLVLKDGRPVPDMRGTEQGRGAYICPKRSCIEQACKRKGAFSRAFRRHVVRPEAEVLIGAIEEALRVKEI